MGWLIIFEWWRVGAEWLEQISRQSEKHRNRTVVIIFWTADRQGRWSTFGGIMVSLGWPLLQQGASWIGPKFSRRFIWLPSFQAASRGKTKFCRLVGISAPTRPPSAVSTKAPGTLHSLVLFLLYYWHSWSFYSTVCIQSSPSNPWYYSYLSCLTFIWRKVLHSPFSALARTPPPNACAARFRRWTVGPCQFYRTLPQTHWSMA